MANINPLYEGPQFGVSKDQIETAAEQMRKIFLQSLHYIDSSISIPRYRVNSQNRLTGMEQVSAIHILADRAKRLFIPALETLIDGQGEESYEWSNRDILDFAVEHGARDLEQALGNLLSPSYRIRLCFDRKKRDLTSESIVTVTEHERELSPAQHYLMI